jgi:hypothetical protein
LVDDKKNKLIHLYTIFVLSIIICFCIYTYHVHEKYDSAILNLKRSKINGKIKNLIEEGRGFTLIEISEQNSLTKISLPISWDVDHFSIEVGDSLRKNPYDGSIYFYKSINGKRKDIFTYNID